MAIGAPAVLTHDGSTTDGQSYTTASITPPANQLIIACIHNSRFSGAPAGTVTLAGNGLTWDQIDTQAFSDNTTELYRLTIFRAMGASPSAGAVTITISGTNGNACRWAFYSISGTDTSGTNGSGAIVQVGKNRARSASPNSVTVTLAALADAANNMVFGMFGSDHADLATPGSGYTELNDGTLSGGDAMGLETQYKLPGTTTPNAGGYTSFAYIAGIAIEIKDGGGAPANPKGPLGNPFFGPFGGPI